MTTITLHSATEQVRELLDQIDPETGELPAELGAARDVVQTKALAVAAYIDDSATMTDAIEAKAKSWLAAAKARRAREDWLRRYLCEHMAALDITELRDHRSGQSIKRYPGRDKSVDIFDAAQLPAEYMREVPARHEPDKPLTRKALEEGRDVPGARIIARDRLVMKT